MIAYVRGILAHKEPTRAIVEACGVGYELFIPLSTYDCLPPVGRETKLFTSHVVREDGQWLYAFAAEEEREMFEKLTCVSGVGPKLAIAVLSGMTPPELASAIASCDSKRIASVKGVGKKTAEKICIELKDKVSALAAFASRLGRPGARQFVKEAALALSALGFSDEAVEKMVSAALEADPKISDTETLVRNSLSGGKK